MVMCEVCEYPIMKEQCLHTAFGFTADEWCARLEQQKRPTTIYLVIWEEGHQHVIVYPFRDKDAAISEARRLALSQCLYPEDLKEYGGWRLYSRHSYYAEYSPEGDSVRVVEAELR